MKNKIVTISMVSLNLLTLGSNAITAQAATKLDSDTPTAEVVKDDTPTAEVVKDDSSSTEKSSTAGKAKSNDTKSDSTKSDSTKSTDSSSNSQDHLSQAIQEDKAVEQQNSNDQQDEQQSNSILNINDINQNIEIVGYQTSTVKLYSLNNNQMTEITSRQLNSGTDWHADKQVIVNGISYYRLSTNEWVRSQDMTRYENVNKVFTNRNNISPLLTPSDVDRAIEPNSQFKVDKIMYYNVGNQIVPYYRIATNVYVSGEFGVLN